MNATPDTASIARPGSALPINAPIPTETRCTRPVAIVMPISTGTAG